MLATKRYFELIGMTFSSLPAQWARALGASSSPDSGQGLTIGASVRYHMLPLRPCGILYPPACARPSILSRSPAVHYRLIMPNVACCGKPVQPADRATAACP